MPRLALREDRRQNAICDTSTGRRSLSLPWATRRAGIDQHADGALAGAATAFSVNGAVRYEQVGPAVIIYIRNGNRVGSITARAEDHGCVKGSVAIAQ